MATPLRIRLHDTPYHITSRVVNGETWLNLDRLPITSKAQRFKPCTAFGHFFRVKRGRLRRTMRRFILYMKKEYGFLISHFVLMDNHYHMIARTSLREYPIDHCMRVFNMMIARWVNKQTGRTGAFFGQRYFSNAVLDNKYGELLLGYIYSNPVRAGLVHTPGAHDFTSYLQYINGREDERGDQVCIKTTCDILAGACIIEANIPSTLQALVDGYMADRLHIRRADFKNMLKSQLIPVGASLLGHKNKIQGGVIDIE